MALGTWLIVTIYISESHMGDIISQADTISHSHQVQNNKEMFFQLSHIIRKIVYR